MPTPVRRTPRVDVMFLLQNQWFRDPDRARRTLATYVTFKGEEAG